MRHGACTTHRPLPRPTSIELFETAAALAVALSACCPQKLVRVSDADGGSTGFVIEDPPDSGGFELPDSGEPRDAGLRDAGEPRDAGHDAGEPDAGEKDAGGGTSGGTSSGGVPPGGTSSGGGGSTSGGTTSGGVPPGGTSGGGGGGVDAGPQCAVDPSLASPIDWTMTADYNISTSCGVPGLVSAFADINSALPTLIAFGVPVPAWATTLFGNLANLQQLFQDINVVSDLNMIAGSDAYSYTAQETWQQVNVYQNGTLVPFNGGNVSFNSPGPYAVTTCSGTATFAQHDISGSVDQIIPAILDGITNISTCTSGGPCYSSFNQAVTSSIDCSQYSGGAAATCAALAGGLLGELQGALGGISFGQNVCNAGGTCTIKDGNDLVNGTWDSSLGTFSAVR